LSAGKTNLFRRHAVGLLDRVDHAHQACSSERTLVYRSTVMFDAEPPSELGVCMPNGKLFGELSVSDQMLSTRSVIRINGEC
jgi:hypothetical protein